MLHTRILQKESMRLVDTIISLECFKNEIKLTTWQIRAAESCFFCDLCVYGMRSIINQKWHHMDIHGPQLLQDKLAALKLFPKLAAAGPKTTRSHAHQMSKMMSNTQHMHLSALLMPSVSFCACATSNQKSKACVKLWKTLLHLANICHKFYKALCLVLTKQKGSSWVLFWTQTARQSCIGSAKQFGETNKSVKVQRPSSLLERTAWLAWSKGLRVEETRRHGRPSAM